MSFSICFSMMRSVIARRNCSFSFCSSFNLFDADRSCRRRQPEQAARLGRRSLRMRPCRLQRRRRRFRQIGRDVQLRSVTLGHLDHNRKAVADFVIGVLNMQDVPSQPADQLDEIFGDPNRAVVVEGFRHFAGLMPLDQLSQRAAVAFLVKGALFVGRDDIQVAAGLHHAIPLLQRLDRIGKMFDDMRADHEIDAAVFERQLVARRHDVHRKSFAAQLDLFLLEAGQFRGVVDVASLQTERVVGGAADFEPFESVEQLVSECAFLEFHG